MKNNLKLDNKELILKHLNVFSINKNMEIIEMMENFFHEIIHETNYLLDDYLKLLQKELNYKTIFETEEELFHVISYTLNNFYEEETLKNCDNDDIKKVYDFLDNNYKKIFEDFYIKKKHCSREDYDECVMSVYSNFILEKEVADILVGKWIEEKIIK